MQRIKSLNNVKVIIINPKEKSFDPREILPPAAVVNFAYAQTQDKATSLNEWSVHHEKGKTIYKVTFGTEGTKRLMYALML